MDQSSVTLLGSSFGCLLENNRQTGRQVQGNEKGARTSQEGFRSNRCVGRLWKTVVQLQEENYVVSGRLFIKLWADHGLTNF